MIKIRPAADPDVDAIFDLIRGLAEYEKLSDGVTGNSELLRSHLFGNRPYAEAIVAELETSLVGYALFFHTYSTFLTQPALHLEDVFVRSEYRQRGVGKALISSVAKIAVDRGCERLEWSVLEWNQNAIDFYQRIGATVLPDWKICRLTGETLTKFGEYRSE